MNRLYYAATALLMIGNLPAEGKENPLSALKDDLVKPMTITDGQFSGPGYQWLLSQSQQVDNLVVGEIHGSREVPALALQLIKDQKRSFDLLALETGAYAIDAVITKGNYHTSYWQQQYGEHELLSYQNNQELTFIRDAAKLLKNGRHAIVGLDKEKDAAIAVLLGQLPTSHSMPAKQSAQNPAT